MGKQEASQHDWGPVVVKRHLQSWPGSVWSHVRLVDSTLKVGWCFGVTLNSTWISSHMIAHSEWRGQSLPSVRVMVPNLLWMEVLLTCHSNCLGSPQLLTLLILCSCRWNNRKGCGLLLCSPRTRGCGFLQFFLPRPSAVPCPSAGIRPPPQAPHKNL